MPRIKYGARANRLAKAVLSKRVEPVKLGREGLWSLTAPTIPRPPVRTSPTALLPEVAQLPQSAGPSAELWAALAELAEQHRPWLAQLPVGDGDWVRAVDTADWPALRTCPPRDC